MFLGKEGFHWWFGPVVNRNDPLKQGRVQVRPIATHDDIEQQYLPWAKLNQESNNPAQKGQGASPTGIQVGSMAFGFYLDGDHMQLPHIIATFHGAGDIHKLALGTNTLSDHKGVETYEPNSPYAAKYPYNKTNVTESGHVFEVDDTPDNERLHQYHKSGTYHEVHPNGDEVVKIVGDSYEVIVGDKIVQINGSVKIKVTGDYIIDTPLLQTTGHVAAATGASGSFTTPLGETVTFRNGIITKKF
jgi:hypothetical protein